MQATTSLSIFQAIPKIMREIDAIGKNKRNTSQGEGFQYRGIDDVYNELHDLLAKYCVFTVPEVLSERSEDRVSRSGSKLVQRVLTMRYTFFAEDGSSVTAVVIGEGMDSGDKASNKAMSIAHKYALIQVFAIQTEDLVDPDSERPEIEPVKPSGAQSPIKPIGPTPSAPSTPTSPIQSKNEIYAEAKIIFNQLDAKGMTIADLIKDWFNKEAKDMTTAELKKLVYELQVELGRSGRMAK